MLMSAIIKTCSTRNNKKKKSVSWRQLLEVGWKQRGESGARAGCEEYVNFSLSAPRVRSLQTEGSKWA